MPEPDCKPLTESVGLACLLGKLLLENNPGSPITAANMMVTTRNIYATANTFFELGEKDLNILNVGKDNFNN